MITCKRCGSIKLFVRSKGRNKSVDGCSDCTRKFPDDDINKIVRHFMK